MKRYGLIGKKLGHSFSKTFFSEYFDRHSIHASYENIELPDLDGIREKLVGFDGFNVTIPYKEAVIPFLDEIDSIAKEIGAVNTVKVAGDKWIGYNTDAFGFHQSIKPFLTNRHERAIVFGTGGASKAIRYILDKIGVDIIQISRSPEVGQFAYEDVNEIMVSNCKLIVNTTPVGMFPNIDDCIDLSFDDLGEDHLVIDLIYNPEKTLLLRKAEEKGSAVLNGASMLKEQALAAYKIWNE